MRKTKKEILSASEGDNEREREQRKSEDIKIERVSKKNGLPWEKFICGLVLNVFANDLKQQTTTLSSRNT